MPDSIAKAETSITAGAKTLTSLLNLAPGPAAVAGFIAEGVFKAIRLGVAIRKAQRAANASLDAQVRAMDVVRLPIAVNLDLLRFQSFFRNEVNLSQFPAFRREFGPELLEFKTTGGNPSPLTRRTLEAAKSIVPILDEDPELSDHPELDDLFTIGLDPNSGKSIRDLVLAYIELFPDGALPFHRHYDRLGGFWQSQVLISLGNINQAQLAAQASLDQAVRGLVTDAIFDAQGGLLASSLDLAKKLKASSIDEQIQALTDQKRTAPDAGKAMFQAKIDTLTKWKARIA